MSDELNPEPETNDPLATSPEGGQPADAAAIDPDAHEPAAGLHPSGSDTESDANKVLDPDAHEHEETGGAGDSHDPAAIEGGPAEDQSPVATENDKVIVGDSGMYEQQPFEPNGAADLVHRTSAPPAALQSGVPLPEDRAAGVTVSGDSAE